MIAHLWAKVAISAAFALFGAAPAWAVCTLPVTLTQGTRANATDVMSNFNALATCIDNVTANLDLAPLSAGLSSLNALYFPTYSQLAGARAKLALSGGISDASGSFRDTLYVENTDDDVTAYSLSHTNYAGRFAAFGPISGAIWQVGTKNIVAMNAYAKGASSGTPLASGALPGVSGFNGDAIQMGEGIGSNEFAAHNPSAASGSVGHSKSLAGVQGIVENSYAASDSTHTAYAFLATATGTQVATAAYGASDVGTYLHFINANTAKVTTSGIIMPGSVSGFVGTIINYGAQNGNPAGGSWTDWLGTTAGGQYRWIDSGAAIAHLDTLGYDLLTGSYRYAGLVGVSCTVVTAGATVTVSGGIITAMTGC